MKTYQCLTCGNIFKSNLAFICCVCSNEYIQEIRMNFSDTSSVLVTGESPDESALDDLFTRINIDSEQESTENPNQLDNKMMCFICDIEFNSSNAECPICQSGFVQQMSDYFQREEEYIQRNRSYLILDGPSQNIQTDWKLPEATPSQPQRCSICWDDFSEQRTRTLSCNHVFHRRCINTWLQTNRTCPICRIRV